MASNIKSVQRIVAAFVAVVGLVLSPALAQADSSIFVPPSRAAAQPGMAYRELSAKWWQYVYSIPAQDNPLLDQTGIDCGVGQSPRSPVFFLVGVRNESGTATRNCTVKAGQRLFFPILSVEADNEGFATALTFAQLQELAAGVVDTTTDLHASVDGVDVPGVSTSDPLTSPFRTVSPPFRFTFPATDNLYGISCTGTTSPTCFRNGVPDPFPGLTCKSTTCTASVAAGDGFYLMLRPLAPGSHTVSFGGTFGPPINFTLNITYHLTVTP